MNSKDVISDKCELCIPVLAIIRDARGSCNWSRAQGNDFLQYIRKSTSKSIHIILGQILKINSILKKTL